MIGEGLFQITIYHGYLLQIIAAEALFTLPLFRREHFWARVALGVPVYAVLAVVIPNFIAQYVSGFFSMIIFFLSLFLCQFCFKARLRDTLYCCVGAQLTQNLSYNIENLIYQPFAQHFTPIGWLCLSVGTTAAVYFLCWLIFVRRIQQYGEIHLPGRYVYAMSVASALFVYTMQFLFQQYEIDRLWIVHLPLILCCIAGLCIQYGLLALRSAQEENRLLERVIQMDQRQYEISRSSINLINMKAHDLKHQVAMIRALGSYDAQGLDEIETAIGQYEASYNTGNRALDVILTEKQILCRQNHIEISVMAQGDALSFLQQADIASLFGNILDNAIEYECTVEPASCRCIALRVVQQGGFVSIRVENYCPNPPTMRDGLPVTSKPDRDNHGFGLRSVRYIAEKHGGFLHLGQEGKLFAVNILFPVSESAPANQTP